MANDSQSRGGGIGSAQPVAYKADAVYTQTINPEYPLGAVMRGWDRTFHYCRASEALTAGKLVTSHPLSFTEGTVTVAHTAGTIDVTITNGSGATINANDLAGGELVVYETTGAGDAYVIAANTSAANAATMTITLSNPLVTTWVAATTNVEVTGPIFRAQEGNTAQIEMPLGVSRIDVTSAYYFWCQTWGLGPALQDEAFGNATDQRVVTIGSSVAGAVEAIDAIGEAEVGQIPTKAADTVDADYLTIYYRCIP